MNVESYFLPLPLDVIHATVNLTQCPLTIVLECFHLVSLLRILSRLIQENRFLQQN